MIADGRVCIVHACVCVSIGARDPVEAALVQVTQPQGVTRAAFVHIEALPTVLGGRNGCAKQKTTELLVRNYGIDLHVAHIQYLCL